MDKLGMLAAAYQWPAGWGWAQNLFNVLNPILYVLMAIVGAAGAIYAIVLGVNLARAEDQSKRDEAKKRLITVLIAVAVTIALVLFFTQLLPLILQAFAGNGGSQLQDATNAGNNAGNNSGDNTGNTTGNNTGNTVKQSIKMLINMIK